MGLSYGLVNLMYSMLCSEHWRIKGSRSNKRRKLLTCFTNSIQQSFLQRERLDPRYITTGNKFRDVTPQPQFGSICCSKLVSGIGLLSSIQCKRPCPLSIDKIWHVLQQYRVSTLKMAYFPQIVYCKRCPTGNCFSFTHLALISEPLRLILSKINISPVTSCSGIHPIIAHHYFSSPIIEFFCKGAILV